MITLTIRHFCAGARVILPEIVNRPAADLDSAGACGNATVAQP
jgi:hypothetical protein